MLQWSYLFQGQCFFFASDYAVSAAVAEVFVYLEVSIQFEGVELAAVFACPA